MLWIVFIILGILQGITEVLPISSTGHLAIAKELSAFRQFDLSIATGLHGGSFFAILYWFRRDVVSVWKLLRMSLQKLSFRTDLSIAQEDQRRLPYYLLASLVPVAIEGYFLRDLSSLIFTSTSWVPLLSILNGIIILITAHFTKGERTMLDLKLSEYLLIGAVQGVAVLPGISRLGLTLCTCLWLHLHWDQALRLTFLLALPIIFGAILLQMPQLLDWLAGPPEMSIGFLVGLIVAAAASLFSLKVLMSSLLERRTLRFFGVYCCQLGVFLLAILVAWTNTSQ